eukprot:gene12819-17189_t
MAPRGKKHNKSYISKKSMRNIEKSSKTSALIVHEFQANKSNSNQTILINSTEITKNTIDRSQDTWSILILLVLYTLQGIPMGLSGSIPLIMKEKGVSYAGLSLFSLVSLPFSMKLLWAPFVDSIYFPKFGRRKSWLVPIQLLTGIIMIFGSSWVELWLEGKTDVHGPDIIDFHPNVNSLTYFFLFLYLLMATQDIAVDGWAITMLSRDNVGYASICNSIGQSLGYFFANQGFIALSDKKWCKTFLSRSTELVDLPDFMHFWGWVFIITTIIVAFFKTEHAYNSSEVVDGFFDTCKQVFYIFKLQSIHKITIIMLTCRIAFGAVDAASTFKFQEYGMPKSDFAMISPLLLVIGLCLPALLGNIVSTRPMNVLLIAIPTKIASSLLIWLLVMNTKEAYANNKTPSIYFFTSLTLTLLLNEIAGNAMFISFMSFFAKISDPSIGGSYMTLLNTICNIGAKWPNVLCLWLIPKLTFSTCYKAVDGVASSIKLNIVCANPNNNDVCNQNEGICVMDFDGYSVETCACVLLGLLWLILFYKMTLQLQSLPHSEWLVVGMKSV